MKYELSTTVYLNADKSDRIPCAISFKEKNDLVIKTHEYQNNQPILISPCDVCTFFRDTTSKDTIMQRAIQFMIESSRITCIAPGCRSNTMNDCEIFCSSHLEEMSQKIKTWLPKPLPPVLNIFLWCSDRGSIYVATHGANGEFMDMYRLCDKPMCGMEGKYRNEGTGHNLCLDHYNKEWETIRKTNAKTRKDDDIMLSSLPSPPSSNAKGYDPVNDGNDDDYDSENQTNENLRRMKQSIHRNPDILKTGKTESISQDNIMTQFNRNRWVATSVLVSVARSLGITMKNKDFKSWEGKRLRYGNIQMNGRVIPM